MTQFIDVPPTLQGEPDNKLQMMYSYLYQMSENLNNALNSISLDQVQIAPAVRNTLTEEYTEEQKQSIFQSAQKLKSMIIKTAEIVRTEMSEIRTQLTSDIEAISSQFGEYERSLTADITATAEGILQQYGFDERIAALDSAAAGFEDYRVHSIQYIKTGQIMTDEVTGLPIYGIAVGNEITTINADGQEIYNEGNKVATFTSDRLSFWQNGGEVAYFSSGKMYITEAEITSNLKMGNYSWRILKDGSMGLVYEVNE